MRGIVLVTLRFVLASARIFRSESSRGSAHATGISSELWGEFGSHMSSNTSEAADKVVTWSWEFSVGTVLPLTDEHCVSFEDWEENDNVEVGGD
jgi:hypothetical protein